MRSAALACLCIMALSFGAKATVRFPQDYDYLIEQNLSSSQSLATVAPNSLCTRPTQLLILLVPGYLKYLRKRCYREQSVCWESTQIQ